MSRTKLYAVQREFSHPQISGRVERRYMVYKPTDNPCGITWTKNIAKASRWGSYADANRAIVEVWGQYDIRSDAIVVEV